jgi:uncharacterized repeat protein (TIGR03803 family)
LYGTTGAGSGTDGGTVFRLSPAGVGYTYTRLYVFCGPLAPGCADGAMPNAGLIMDRAGNLYGTTASYGARQGGTVFRLAPAAGGGFSYSVLYAFCSQANCADGSGPVAGLTMDAAGDLFGTTKAGGTGSGGTLFRLTPSGAGYSYSVLYNFCSQPNCSDGGAPGAGVVLDAAGGLYGTTSRGGGATRAGTVFKLAWNGAAYSYTVLHVFCSQDSCADGSTPYGDLARDAAGNIYGTTNLGGRGRGTVFAVSAGGVFSTLYAFGIDPANNDGANPLGGVAVDRAGNLVGTTQNAGANNRGTAYRLTTATLTVGKTGTGGGAVQSSPAGIDCGTACGALFAAGSPVALSAIPAPDSAFAGWAGAGCGRTGPCLVTMNGAQNVTAGFTLTALALPLSVSVTGSGAVNSNPANIACPATCSGYFPTHGSVTLTPVPSPGWFFASWGGACSGAGPSCTVTMDAAQNVAATFVPGAALNVSISAGGGVVVSSPPGINCRYGDQTSACGALFAPGSQVVLTAQQPVYNGYGLSGWTGCDSSSGASCTITINGPRNVSAIFGILSYVTVQVYGGAGAVTSSPPGINCPSACYAAFATPVTLTAVAPPGLIFTGWDGRCAGAGTCTLTSTGYADAYFWPGPPPLNVIISNGNGTVQSSPAGINCGSACIANFMPGMVTLTATPAPGYRSAHWGPYGACNTSSPVCTVNMYTYQTAYAYFTQ